LDKVVIMNEKYSSSMLLCDSTDACLILLYEEIIQTRVIQAGAISINPIPQT